MGVKTRGRGTSASFWGPGSAAAGRRRCSQGPKSQLGPRRWFKKYLNIRKNARVRAEARKLRSKLNYLASNWVSGAQDRQHWARGAAPWPAVWYSCASCGIPALLVAYLCFLWCCCASRGILVLLVVPLCFLWYPCAPCGILWPAVVFVVFRGRLRDPVVFCGTPLCPHAHRGRQCHRLAGRQCRGRQCQEAGWLAGRAASPAPPGKRPFRVAGQFAPGV